MDFEYIHTIENVLEKMSDSERIAFINKGIKENNDKKEEDIFLKNRAIKFLEDDKIKIEFIKQLDEKDRLPVIMSLKKYEDKIQCINDMKEDKWIADCARELLNPVDQIMYLSKISSLEYKMYLLENYKGADIDVLTNIDLVQNDIDKSLLISKIKHDEQKLSIVSKLKDEKSIIRVIRSLDDDTIKLEYIDKIKDSKGKVSLIASLKNDDLKKEILEIDKTKILEFNIPDGMTVGMEIECEGEYSPDILTSSNDIINGWKREKDNSLKNGVEIVSPILTNSKENSENVYFVCDVLKEMGQEVSENCGGHIHFGADYLKTKESIKNLIELWSNNEKIIYMMCNGKEDKMRSGVIDYAEPLSKKIETELEEKGISYEQMPKEQFINKMKDIQNSKKNEQSRGRTRTGINLNNIGDDEKNTIEFRIPNGTLNPQTWIENTNLFGNIISTAQKIAELQGKNQNELTEEEKNYLVEFEDLNLKELTEEERVNKFLDLTLGNENKQIYYERYLANKNNLIENEELNKKLDERISNKPIVFDTQKIGKNTINTPIQDKDEAADVVNRRLKQRNKVNEVEQK